MLRLMTMPDNRKLGYCIVGKGHPVLYFHGTASSRLEVMLLKDLAEMGGLQIIGVDRPGYGSSTYCKRKSLQNFNGDMEFLVHSLGLENFTILGWSGGAAFALAYLAQYPERVTKAVVAAAPNLPFDVSTAHNFPFARYILKVPFIASFAMRQLRRQVLKTSNAPSAFIKSSQGKQMLRGYSESDLRFFSDPDWLQLMYLSMTEAFRQESGVKAVVEEHKLFMKPWDFSFTGISSGKLVIWHGLEDKTCRVSNAYELSRLVKGSVLEVFSGKGHCVMFDNKEKLAELLLK
jgi:pimeloyl-ACP methyl ester carboxylesterase